MMDKLLKSVIDDYLSEVEKGMGLFKEKIGHTHPLTAWHNKEIPQRGSLPGGVEYEFHGIGCALIFPGYEVDFDFGPDDRCDGFDLWRLSQYVRSRSEKYKEYKGNEKLKKHFDEAVKQGEIGKLDHPYCNLYYYK